MCHSGGHRVHWHPSLDKFIHLEVAAESPLERARRFVRRSVARGCPAGEEVTWHGRGRLLFARSDGLRGERKELASHASIVCLFIGERKRSAAMHVHCLCNRGHTEGTVRTGRPITWLEEPTEPDSEPVRGHINSHLDGQVSTRRVVCDCPWTGSGSREFLAAGGGTLWEVAILNAHTI